MVMGPTHAMSGVAGGLALATIIPADWGAPATPTETLTFAAVTAGAALLPDIDHPHTTVARSFGVVSQALAVLVARASLAFFELTKSRYDEQRTSGHRTLTHTALFAVTLSAAVAVVCGLLGKPAAAVVLFVMLGLALRGLLPNSLRKAWLLPNWARKNGWVGVSVVAAGLSVVAFVTLPDSGQGWLGPAIGVGMLLHCLGDLITSQGCPLLAPVIRIRGKNWWDIALPSMLRIKAGGLFEHLVLWPVLAGASVLLALTTLPGGDMLVQDLLGS